MDILASVTSAKLGWRAGFHEIGLE